MRPIAGLLRNRLRVGALAALALGWVDATARLTPVDHALFRDAAARLFSERWATAFIDGGVQVGPIYLALFGSARRLAQGIGVDTKDVLCVATEVLTTVGVMLTVRAVVGRHRWGPALELAAGVATLAGGLAWTAWASGHPEEVAIGLIWVWSARLALRRRAPAAGLMLGVAAGLKLWGALGLPLLLLDGQRRRSLSGALVACGVVAALYGPFFLFGEVNTFEFRWPVDSPLLEPVVGEDELFPWPLRVLQGIVTVGLGAALAVRSRARAHVEWALPLGLVLIRILFDPLPHYYFWLPIEAIALVGAAALATTHPKSVAIVAGAGVYLMLAWRFMPMPLGFYYRIVLSGALLMFALRDRVLGLRQIQHQV